MRYLLLAAASFLVASTSSASMRDEIGCKSGYVVGFDLSDIVSGLEKRLVACVNHIQTVEVDNHNDQQRLIRELHDRITVLETQLNR